MAKAMTGKQIPKQKKNKKLSMKPEKTPNKVKLKTAAVKTPESVVAISNMLKGNDRCSKSEKRNSNDSEAEKNSSKSDCSVNGNKEESRTPDCNSETKLSKSAKRKLKRESKGADEELTALSISNVDESLGKLTRSQRKRLRRKKKREQMRQQKAGKKEPKKDDYLPLKQNDTKPPFTGKLSKGEKRKLKRARKAEAKKLEKAQAKPEKSPKDLNKCGSKTKTNGNSNNPMDCGDCDKQESDEDDDEGDEDTGDESDGDQSEEGFKPDERPKNVDDDSEEDDEGDEDTGDESDGDQSSEGFKPDERPKNVDDDSEEDDEGDEDTGDESDGDQSSEGFQPDETPRKSRGGKKECEKNDDDGKCDEMETADSPEEVKTMIKKKKGKKSNENLKDDNNEDGVRKSDSLSGKDLTIFMGNVDFKATEEDIRGFVERVLAPEEIDEIELGKNPQGKPRGFGFLKVTTSEAFEKALKLNGQKLHSREVRMLKSEKKSGDNRRDSFRSSSRGSFRGGFGGRGGSRGRGGFRGNSRGRGGSGGRGGQNFYGPRDSNQERGFNKRPWGNDSARGFDKPKKPRRSDE